MVEYASPLRTRIVHLLVEQLVDLDVQIAQQLKALEEAADDDDTIFEVESDATTEELAKMRLNANKLDTLVSMLAHFVRDTCTRGGGGASPEETGAEPAAVGEPATAAATATAADGALGGEEAGGAPPESPPRKAKAEGEEEEAAESDAAARRPLRAVGEKCASSDALPRLDADDRSAGQPVAKVARSTSALSPSASAVSALDACADPAPALFESLIAAFRVSILPTYKCRCVQYLIFYGCSFEATYGRTFVRLMLAQLTSEQTHAEARMACAAYIASFLARATFVSADLVIATAREILRWATEYQTRALARLPAGAAPSLDVHLHGPFYASVQGLLYTLVYKHELLGSVATADALAALGPPLHALLAGPLNPLKFCLEAIVLEFERLDLCDVSEVVAANERLVVASTSAGGAPNRLDDFFPFDPLHGFPTMAALVAPHFQEWRPRRGASEPRDSNLSGVSHSEDASGSLATSLQGMSVTPRSGDETGAAMADHMRRRLAENRSMLHGLVTSPLVAAHNHAHAAQPSYFTLS